MRQQEQQVHAYGCRADIFEQPYFFAAKAQDFPGGQIETETRDDASVCRVAGQCFAPCLAQLEAAPVPVIVHITFKRDPSHAKLHSMMGWLMGPKNK